jgi:hypothetical protein
MASAATLGLCAQIHPLGVVGQRDPLPGDPRY